jgi:hydrophobic/amphiphilic exporter-1 (mainly G- bacteria), HAE1 family
MSLPELCIKRPVFTTMLILLPVVLGLVGLFRMGVDLFPNVDLPIVTITTTRQGASAEEMETGVTKKIEEAVNTISGIDELASTSKEGISSVRVQFLLEKNSDVAQQEVQGKVSAILSQLPTGTDTPIIDKFDLDAAPVLSVAVSAPRDLKEVTEVADKQISDSLSSLSGVGAVTLTGGWKRAIQVAVNIDKLQAYGLSVEDVEAALGSQNLEVPGGRVDQNSRELTLRTMGRIVDTRDFNNIIIKTINGQPIRVRDVGHAEDSIEEPRTLSEVDGTNAVNLIVQKQSGTNTVDVIHKVKDRLAELRQAFAAEGKGDIQLKVVRDQSTFIEATIHEVRKHLLIGAVLVSLTILLFLRDWRTMVIASISIPVSIVSTCLCMYVMGFTFNNITMLAMVMSVGIVIDDAVVVHENIFRWMEEKGLSAWDAALGATKEIALAVMATTFSLIVIFLPIAFMSGRVGRFFQSFGITMAFAIFVSLIVSFTLTPMLCSRFLGRVGRVRVMLFHLFTGDFGRHPDFKQELVRLRATYLLGRIILPNPATSHHSGGVYGWVAEKPYMLLLRLSLRHRWVVVVAAFVVMFSLFPWPVGKWASGGDAAKAKQLAWMNYPGLIGLLGFDFIPQDDQSEFEVAITTPSGYTLERGRRAFEEIDARLKKLRGVQHTIITIGDTTGKLTRATGPVTQGTIYVQLTDITERSGGIFDGMLGIHRDPQKVYSQFEVMKDAREIMKDYPDLRSSVQLPVVVASGQANADLEATLNGPDLEKLSNYADLIVARMRKVPGLADADTTLPERNPELRVNIDRNRASQFDLPVKTIAGTLQTLVGGQVIGDYKDNSTGEQYDVWLRAETGDRSTRSAIDQMTIYSPRSGLVKLSNVANLEEARGPAQIDRFQRQRKITLIANLAYYTKHNQFLFFAWDSHEKLPTGDGVTALNKIVADMRAEGVLPADYVLTFGGRAKTMAESMGAFVIAFGLSLIFMYMILAAQFESFVHPITILLAVPLTIPFAVLSLVVLHQSANLYAILGIFLLFGIVKKNGILQVDYTNHLRKQGLERNKAVLDANKTRLRPILMTTVMLVAGMIPIALGVGPGAASRASMAKVIIGGQVLSLLLTLLVTPVAYTLFDDVGRITRKVLRLRGRDEPSGEPSDRGANGHKEAKRQPALR